MTLPTCSRPLRELDVVDGGVDRRERAQHVLDVHARLKRRVALRVERFGLRHAAGHPEHDDRIGRRLRGRRAGALGEAGSRPASAASVAAAVAPMKPRRLTRA